MATLQSKQQNDYSLDSFMNCFIAELVLRNKKHIWIRGTDGSALRERRRMDRACRFMDRVVDATDRKNVDGDWYYFILRLRNNMGPSPIGSFDNFIHLFRGKLLTWTSMTAPFYECYNLEMQKVTAKSILSHYSPEMRQLSRVVAKAYMLLPERYRR
jgi:hypothetical protein